MIVVTVLTMQNYVRPKRKKKDRRKNQSRVALICQLQNSRRNLPGVIGLVPLEVLL